MAFVHGKNTVLKINAVDLSSFSNMTDFDNSRAASKVTCYGADRERYGGGLGDGKVTHSGVYDDGATGPGAVLLPLMETAAEVPWIFQPEGAGSGKAQRSANVIITSYKESSPVGDYVKWSCELQMSGPLSTADQA